MNLDFNHREIELETAIFCEDLRMITVLTNQLFTGNQKSALDQAADFYNGKSFDRKYGSNHDGLE